MKKTLILNSESKLAFNLIIKFLANNINLFFPHRQKMMFPLVLPVKMCEKGFCFVLMSTQTSKVPSFSLFNVILELWDKKFHFYFLNTYNFETFDLTKVMRNL